MLKRITETIKKKKKNRLNEKEAGIYYFVAVETWL